MAHYAPYKIRRCAALNCSNNSTTELKLSFFKYPLSEDRCKIWAIRTGRTDLLAVPIKERHQNNFVCSVHFEECMYSNVFRKNRLNPDALPGIFNFCGYSQTWFENMPGCVAVGCTNSAQKGFLMKRFPRDPNRRMEWQLKMRRCDWSPTEFSCLCEVHFVREMWEKTREDGSRKLRVNAVPTIFSCSQLRTGRRPPFRSKSWSPAKNTLLAAETIVCEHSYANRIPDVHMAEQLLHEETRPTVELLSVKHLEDDALHSLAEDNSRECSSGIIKEEIIIKEEEITIKEEEITIKEEEITIKEEEINIKEEEQLFKQGELPFFLATPSCSHQPYHKPHSPVSDAGSGVDSLHSSHCLMPLRNTITQTTSYLSAYTPLYEFKTVSKVSKTKPIITMSQFKDACDRYLPTKLAKFVKIQVDLYKDGNFL